MAGQFTIELDRTANQPIPEGIHPFTVAEIEEGESKAHNPMWTVTLACGTPGQEGKTARLFLVLTPEARWKLEQFLDAVGAPTSGTATSDKFKGRKLRAQVTHQDYEGRKQANIGEMWSMTTNPKAAQTVTPAATAKVTPTTGRRKAAIEEAAAEEA